MNDKKTSGLTKSLISFIFVLMPGLIIWFFLSKDWTNDPIIPYPYIWLVAFIFIFVTTLISWLFIKFKIAWYDLFNFTIPITILMMIILVTYPLSSWIRAIIVIPSIIFTTLPTNMVIARISENHIDSMNVGQNESHS